jgi:hypothetical protein
MAGVERGIFLWAQPHFGAMHVGDIVQRAMLHKTWKIALLSVAFPLEDVLRMPAVYGHTGGFDALPDEEPWVLHMNEPVILLSRTAPPERIRLIADYDLEELLAVSSKPPAAGNERRVRRSSRTPPGTRARPAGSRKKRRHGR